MRVLIDMSSAPGRGPIRLIITALFISAAAYRLIKHFSMYDKYLVSAMGLTM